MVLMAAKDVSEKAIAVAALERVKTRRAERASDSILDSAKTKLDQKAIVEALELLHRYVTDRHATKKPEAEQLLADCDVATSESAAVNTLVAMSDEQFARFKNTGKLDDRQVTYPVLLEIRATTFQRNLETANQRREENKIAEANCQAADRASVAAKTDQYVKQQIQELEAGAKKFEMRFSGYDRIRVQAVDNLKALGPAAIPAVPALVLITLNDQMWDVKRKAIEILGEIGGLRGMLAVAWAFQQYGYDSELTKLADNPAPHLFGRDPRSYRNEIAKAAEDSLLKLLPAVGRDLTVDDAIFLVDVHRSGNKRVSPAIENAWAVSEMIQASMAQLRGVPAWKMPGAAGQTDYMIRAINHIANTDKYAFTQAGVLNTWQKEMYQIWNEAHPNDRVIRGPAGNLMPANWNASLGRIGGDGGKTVRDSAEVDRSERERTIQRQNYERAANSAQIRYQDRHGN